MPKVVILDDLGADKALILKRFKVIMPSDYSLVWYEGAKGTIPEKTKYLVVRHAVVTRNMILDSKLAFVSVSNNRIDNIDIDAARECSVKVTSVPCSDPMPLAELELLLALSLLRKLKASDTAVRTGKWETRVAGMKLYGRCVGIIGDLPSAVASAGFFAAAGCHLLCAAKERNPEMSPHGVKWVGFNELLSESDIITLHAELPADGGGALISYSELAKVKKTAIIINVTGGKLIDTDALSRALETGRLAGAGLDVFENEPPLPGKRILHAPNTVFTPHIGLQVDAGDGGHGRIVERLDRTFRNLRAFIDSEKQETIEIVDDHEW